MRKEYDFVIIGSGFGGSVSALRLIEKGYSVLLIEKGDWKKPEDFPKTNWNLKKWLWFPPLGFKGIFKLTFLRHLSVISGVGVGGGSLVYANTLPVPKDEFFNSGSWKGILNWEKELTPFYKTAKYMLGVSKNPELFDGDNYLNKLSTLIGKESDFAPTDVAVYFGDSDKDTKDPFFNGEGPDRKGCDYCGRCMTGCPNNAKNTLDKNYLYLAQKKGLEILANNYVTDVKPIDNNRYSVVYRKTGKYFSKQKSVTTKGVIFSGGVLGTVPLLLKLKKSSLPNLSDMVGKDVRSNNEALIFVTTPDKSIDMSKGVAIGSILHSGKNSHMEPVRYGSGSGAWRVGTLPKVSEPKLGKRLFKLIISLVKSPIKWLKVLTVRNFAKQTIVLLYMQNLEGKLSMKKGSIVPKTSIQQGEAPSAFLPEAHDLANKYAKLVGGKPMTFVLETLVGTPSTAHILGGAVIGADKKSGVIDKNHKVFGYDNMYICDGSAISANPGVNPALTITAMSERAISKIQSKKIV